MGLIELMVCACCARTRSKARSDDNQVYSVPTPKGAALVSSNESLEYRPVTAVVVDLCAVRVKASELNFGRSCGEQHCN